MWQIVKLHALRQVHLEKKPEMVKLLEAHMSVNELLKYTREDILLKWVNYHMEQGETYVKVANFTSDFSNLVAYRVLLA